MRVPLIEWHRLALQLGVRIFSSPSGYTLSSSIKDTHNLLHSFSAACSALALAWHFLLKVTIVALTSGPLFTFCPHPWGFQPSVIFPLPLVSLTWFQAGHSHFWSSYPLQNHTLDTWGYCVAEVTKPENLHCNTGKRLHGTPSSAHPNPPSPSGTLESQHHCYVSRSLSLHRLVDSLSHILGNPFLARARTQKLSTQGF